MGLDTSHDCWHGPYSAFNRWRSHLHVAIMADRGTPDEHGLDGWDRLFRPPSTIPTWTPPPWPYQSDSDPLDFLMSHSDCDGEIPAAMCGPLADALDGLMERRMPARALYDIMRPATERFIAGLRLAASRGEAVEFG